MIREEKLESEHPMTVNDLTKNPQLAKGDQISPFRQVGEEAPRTDKEELIGGPIERGEGAG